MGVSILAGGDPCAALFGSMKQTCENTGKLVNGSGGGGGGGTTAGSMLTDPLGSIAKSCAEAAAWVINQVSGAVSGTSGVDFANSGFLKQYAIVFAASTILTVVLWILAVIKRAVRGDSIVTAVTEATGFLWLAVGASAFTPVVLYGMVKLTDSVTDAIGSTTSAGTNSFLSSFANTLSPSNGSASTIGGGPILLVFISLLSMIAAALLWVELLIRAAMLYVGAALAGAVYAGLVDKDLWPHVRRWAGMMIAVDLVKPVIVIVLGLAAAISSGSAPGSPFASVLSGLAIMALSIFASGLIYRFVPNFGDDMLKLAGARSGEAPAQVAQGALDGPATRMQQGIAAHGARSGNPVAAPALAALGAGAGLAAQGLRASARLALQRPEPNNPGGIGVPGAGGPGGPGALPPASPTLPSANSGRGAADPARTLPGAGAAGDPGGKGTGS